MVGKSLHFGIFSGTVSLFATIPTACCASYLPCAGNSAAGVAPNIGGIFNSGVCPRPRRPVGGFIPQPSEYPTARRFGGLS